MTVGDVISSVDALEPNQYNATQKKLWLQVLDGKILDEVIRTHRAQSGGVTEYPVYSALTQSLLVPSPYGEEIYNRWLQAMIAAENGESARYAQQVQLFNAAYQAYADMYNRNVMPLASCGENRLRY